MNSQTDLPPVPSQVADEPAAEPEAPNPHGQFVDWMRSVAPYIHAFRNKTFVVAFGGELVQEGRLVGSLVNPRTAKRWASTSCSCTVRARSSTSS